MLSVRFTRSLMLIALLALARSASFVSLAIPSFVTMAAALLAMLLPGVWLAQALLRADRSPASHIAWGFAFSLAIISLGSISFHLTGAFGLGGLLIFVMTYGYVVALFAPPPRSKKRPPGGPEIALLVAAVAIVAVASSPRIGYLTDAYDHLGTVRWMTIENQAYPVESFHADRAAAGFLDPRKGTFHTTFALACALSGVDPVDGYRAFWTFTLLIAFSSILTASRAFLGCGRPAWIGFILFAVLHRGGPAGEWFATAGYPGSAGLWLYLLFLGEIVRKRNDNEGAPVFALATLGLATVGVHLFYGLLAGLAFLYLFVGLAIFRRGAGTPALTRAGLAFGAGALPVAIFRYFKTYDPVNPLHLHKQAVIELTERLAVLDYTPVLQALGIGGLLALLFVPFLDWRGTKKPDTRGELFLGTSLVGTFLIVWNPIVFPLLEPHLGYLMRRIPYAVPWAFVFAAVAVRPYDRRTPAGRSRTVAYAALLIVALTAGWDATRKRAPRAKPASGVEEMAQQIVSDAAGALPALTTVLTDPVTSYVMFGRTSLRPVAILDQHSSPNDSLAAGRISESQRALHPATGSAEFYAIIRNVAARHVLIATGYPRDFQTYNAYYSPHQAARTDSILSSRPDIEPLSRFEGAALYKIADGSGLDDIQTYFRPWATGGRFSRPEGAVDLPGGVTLAGARLGTSEGRPGDLIWLQSDWTLSHADAGAVPMLLYVRGRALAAGSPAPGPRSDRPWKIFSLGGRDFPYLLWKKGEQIAYDAPLRIPKRVGPGLYEVQITTDMHPFFAVRRLQMNGLRFSAARSGWTAVDTVEVKP